MFVVVCLYSWTSACRNVADKTISLNMDFVCFSWCLQCWDSKSSSGFLWAEVSWTFALLYCRCWSNPTTYKLHQEPCLVFLRAMSSLTRKMTTLNGQPHTLNNKRPLLFWDHPRAARECTMAIILLFSLQMMSPLDDSSQWTASCLLRMQKALCSDGAECNGTVWSLQALSHRSAHSSHALEKWPAHHFIFHARSCC